MNSSSRDSVWRDETDHQTPPAARAARWRLRDAWLYLQTPQIMAVCNVTPDSFSDGGEHCSVDLALQFAEAAWQAGATILDVGGESTRPGATPVAPDTEIARVVPVIEAVRAQVPAMLISVDTVKSTVARAAIEAGAHAVNDVSAGRLDPAIFGVVASTGAGLVLMHSRGSVHDMASYAHASYGADAVGEMIAELLQRVSLARAAGVADDTIVLDPGLGFSKTSAQSVEALRSIGRFVSLGHPVLVGASRKRFIGELTGVTEPSRRVTGSVTAHVLAVQGGARIVRTHDVEATRHGLSVAGALGWPGR